MPIRFDALPELPFTLDDSFSLVTYDEAAAQALTVHAPNDGEAAYYHRQYPNAVAPNHVYLLGRHVGYLQESDDLENLLPGRAEE